MIEYETDHNRFIYHYTKLETIEKYILPNGTMRLSQYTKTNDPKESRNWQFEIGTNNNVDLSKYSMDKLSKWLSYELKAHTNLACFSKDQPDLTGDNFSDLFKRGYVKPRMWAQYANNHNGVCIVIDKSKFIKEVKRQVNSQDEVVYGDVAYVDVSPMPNHNALKPQPFVINIDTLESFGRKEYVLRHLSTYYKELFFQKLQDWKDESEWRCIVFTSDANDIYIKLKHSFVGIIYGNNLKNDDIRQLMSLSEEYELEHLGLKWKNSTLWYDYPNQIYLGQNRELNKKGK